MKRVIQLISLSIFLFCHLPTSGIGAITPDKITAHPALDYFAAPSLDGRYLAFVSERSGNPDIWLKSLATGIISLPRQLTTHPAVDRDPAINANGTKLLYVSHKTDPRGDVYLLDLVTGEETQLTDLQSGDSIPQWESDGESILYLKKELKSGTQSVVRRMLGSEEEQEIVRGTTAFSVGQQDWIVYIKDGTLRIVNARDPETDSAMTSEAFLDSWPTHVFESPPLSKDTQAFSFTRYEEDTNQDGVVDPDDESSIWFTRWNNASLQTVALFRLTPSGHFHVYPASAGDHVYFSDLKKGDIYRINIKDFFQDYTSFERAQELGTLYLDSGQRDRALLVSTNISNNLAPQLSLNDRAAFDLSYAENLMESGKYSMAQVVLSPYLETSGRIGALAHIQAIVLDIHQRAPMVGFAELTQLVKNGVGKVMAIGEEHRDDEVVYGQALIDSGRLYLLIEDSLSALDYLVQVDQLQNKEVRAKALFTRGTVYRTVGDEASLLQVFIDVIGIFGEESSWGRRAVTQAIAVSERGDDVHQQVASLQELINQHSDLPLLVASTRLRIANLYDESGEELKAIEALDQILAEPPPFPPLVEQSYRRKAEILASTEHYQEAADTYAALVKLTGEDEAGLARIQRLMVLQLVRKALKDRKIGEVRIAAKAFKQIIDEHPESVEAHRAYIETKVMLKELPEVQAYYHQLVKEHPKNPVYLYSQGLALSYSTPPDFSAVIKLMEQAIQKDPGISYFHQTLGWAYEQEERIHGKKGSLEKAEGEYRIALELNDEFQFPQVESNLLLNLGNIYMALHNFREAYRHYHQRETRFAPTGDTVTELVYRKNYGEACFKSGRSEESLTQYRIALKRVPADQKVLQAELLERIGLSQQDLGRHSEAVESFSQAMEINSELGNHKNMALLQRNIGVNLYNLSISKDGGEREALKKALKSYFASLDNMKQFGVKEQKKGTGLFNLDIALEGGGSQAATGFDREGEEKLMFSYIAGTYEKLSEPVPARDYYLKKLALISASQSSETDVAYLTEKAIVLNRIGKLSYELGSRDEALDYMHQSLRYTRTLDLKYGIGVNLYNISRLIAEKILANETIDWPIVDTLVTVLDEHVSTGQANPQTFFALTNTAFILANLPNANVAVPQTPEDTVQHSIALYRYQTHAWSYYTKAEKLLQTDQIFSNGRMTPTLVALKLNMLELAQGAGNQGASKRLQDDLLGLVQDQSAPNGWLWYLSQAEKAEGPVKQKEFLLKAFDTLMALPAQVQIRGSSQTGFSIDRLSHLYVDLLVQEGSHDQAFAVIEQLNMRKVTAVLYEALGEEYFLKGLGDYEGELRELFADIRTTLAEGNRDELDELSPQLEEILYALYEEYPWAAASFWHYAPNADVLSVAVTPEHPYLKVVTGRNGYHGFIHDGETLQYGEVVWKNGKLELPEKFNQVLSNSTSLYLSLPQDLAAGVDGLPLSGQSLTLVTTFYDFVNGYHLRNLFYANIATTTDFALQPDLTAGEIPISLHRLNGTTDHDREILQFANMLVTSGKQDEFAFEVNKELQVRELLLVKDLAGGSRHTSVMFNLQHLSEGDITHLVWGLLRAGFPHIIVHRGTDDLKTIEQFVSLYLAYLADLPPNEAVTMASVDIFGEDETRQHNFVLYGYAGMDEEEKYELGSSIYSEELDQAVVLYKEQRYQEALHRMENALSVISYADKTEDFGELTKLTVDASFRMGDYQKAVFHQEKLLNSLGEDVSVEEKSETLYRLGILYSRLEKFDTAIQHLESAIALWSEAEELDRLAEGIATLGVVRENMGAYSDALADFSRSFELYQEIGEIGDVATQYRRIGRIYYLRLNRYEKAREKLLAALDSYRELEDRNGEAETLYEIGLTYEKMGLFDEAVQYYEKGKVIAAELQDPFLIATGDLYLANTAWFRGNYQRAFENLTRADKLAAESQDAQLSIMVKNTRGLIYWTLNDTDKGLVYLKQAVALAEKADIKTELASSLNNLGLIYRQRGDYVTSLDYFEKAKAIDVELNSRWGLGYDYRNIGMSLLKLNRLPEAETNFVKAEQTSAEIKNAINWVKALLELGNVNRDLQKPEKARGYYQQAYELSKRYGIKEVEWRAALGQATLLRHEGKRDVALSWYAKGVEVVEGMRATIKIDELRNSFQENKLDLYRDIISLLVDMGRREEAFNYLERSRSRSFIDLLGNQKLTLHNQADQDALDTIGRLSLEVEALKSEIGSYEEPPQALIDQYEEVKAKQIEALIELKLQNPSLSTFVTVDPLTQRDIEELLEPKIGLLSYMLGKDKGYIWLLTNQGTTFYEIPTTEEDIVQTVTQYRNSVQHLEPVDDELKKLYGLLIKPVEKDLAGLEYLGIIPDGPLHFLSFSALQDEKGYLVDQYPLFYTPSGSVLKFTFAKRKKEKVTKVLAVGNPDLGNYNYDLPLAELEAKSIRWNYPNMEILTREKANKEWFVKNLSNYGIIHLASHGEFDELNPLLSSLWLASENPNNRRLTVKEIFGLEINADLVTLSACQTGLGQLKAGELIGLNRAFIYAGTHALVSALWRVDDLSTSVLMKHFYRSYVTLDKAKSLRQAQLIVKREFPHPSYWAGFSLIGDYK